MSFILRAARTDDLEHLYEMAKLTGGGFTNLPPDRTALGACAPRTHAMASTTFDLPEPLGPTTTVTPGSRSIDAASAKDLKPLSVRFFRCIGSNLTTRITSV